jgi:hypothetical protein
MVYTPKYFKAYELVGPVMYNKAIKANAERRLFYVFNPFLLMTADLLREKYGPATINNWKVGGTLKERGLRDPDTSTGALFSAHKFGCALDMSFKNATAEEIREEMKKVGCFDPGFRYNTPKGAEHFKYIHRVESTLNGKPISWFHMDIYNSFNEDGSIISLNV